ncbi:MAG TPA: hypothetical protein VJQ53_00290 [Candidatus Eisenbacteria bacterium]|nr:hypothetical protein [Candidatus Eisenbacteria bacterium]
MKRLAASLVAAAALLGSALAGTALAQDTNAQGASVAPKTFDAQQGWSDQSDNGWSNQNQWDGDRSGQDRYRGDDSGWDRNAQDQNGWDRNGSNWGSSRGRFAMLEGRWVMDDRSGDFRYDRADFRGRGPMRQILLPDRIQIDQRPSMVRIADSRNHPLQLIMLGGKFDSRRGDRPDYVSGRWRGSTLVVERSTQRGATITQTFALENRGRTLVVRTRREGFGPRTMEITSTYRRA